MCYDVVKITVKKFKFTHLIKKDLQMRIQTGFKTIITVLAQYFIKYHYHTYWKEYTANIIISLCVLY
jgi:hypothetical protein